MSIEPIKPVTVNINNQQIPFSSEKIPTVWDTTEKIFMEALPDTAVPSKLRLTNKVVELSTACEELLTTKKNLFRDRMLLVLGSALAVAFAVAVVFAVIGMATNPFTMMALTILLLKVMLYNNVAQYFANRVGLTGPDKSFLYKLLALVVGPFCPLYEVCTSKIPAMQKKIDGLKQELEKEIGQAIDYYKDNGKTIEQHINQENIKAEVQAEDEKAAITDNHSETFIKMASEDNLRNAAWATLAVAKRRKENLPEPAERLKMLKLARADLKANSEFFAGLLAQKV